jgi:hypothetical protein
MDIFNYLDRHKIIPFLKKWKMLSIVLGSIDILAIAMAFQCAFYLNYHEEVAFFFLKSRTLKLFILILPFWLVILYLIQVAEIPRTKRYKVLFYQYFQSTILIVTLLLIFYFTFQLYLDFPSVPRRTFTFWAYCFFSLSGHWNIKYSRFTGQRDITL